MLSGLVLSVALSATMVPPGNLVENHASPYIYTQPTLRQFERRQDEMDRRLAWEAHVKELDILWAEYRDAGSTPRAWREFNKKAAEAKRRYIYADPFYAPVLP